MEYRRLGSTGLKVSEIGLGGNNFGWWADEQTSIPVIKHALEAGINFIDTADMYDRGNSEEFVGKAIKGRRSEVIVATKFSSSMGDGPNEKGGSRYYIMKAVEASLKRLQTDYIDLYQMHFPDTGTPIEETLRVLDDLIRSGKVRYIGCSNFSSWQLCEALWTSRVNNLHSFVTVQPQYSLLSRQIEQELVPCCQSYGIGVIPYSPLAGGFLTGKYRKGEEPPSDGRLSKPGPASGRILNDPNWEKLAKLEAFATGHGHTVGELAIAWLLSKPYVSTIIAGVRKPEQVSANVAAAEWKLTDEETNEVDAID
ncbi:MAG: aldo/keto reductase [Dehalococcoidales bacterium]|nr:aldo/keto reductase [Dehalococcoidales bacterium]